MSSIYEAPPLMEYAKKQQSHKELLTQEQVENAKLLGIKSITTKNTQYDLLKILRFKTERKRKTSNFTRNLVKKHGRKKTGVILKRKVDEINK